MFIGDHARENPEHIAHIMASSGEFVTYGELDRRSSCLAQVFRENGIKLGHHIALFMENDIRYLEVCWAAMRSGLYLTPINSHLSATEVAYILDDCDAEGLVTTEMLVPTAIEALSQMANRNRVHIKLLVSTTSTAQTKDATSKASTDIATDELTPVGDTSNTYENIYGFQDYEEAVKSATRLKVDDERLGELMLYSSGVTGRPKGIVRPLRDAPATEGLALSVLMRAHYGMDEDTIYLSTAPLYHAAPLGFCLGVQTIGGTVVIMERFEAENSLKYIEQYAVTHSQWVPTMFVRLLRLPEAVKHAYKLETHKVSIHAAAPCPLEIKERMMDWWGPILYEYYGGSEFNGFTNIPPQEWLTHRGSVGRASVGEIHILDDNGNDLPSGEIGTVYFAHGGSFEYHNDPIQTAGSRSPQGWTTIGDVGYLDDDGYLYLTDRKADMVISGGVNIYPKEVENVLIMHPLVDDVAVIGIPDDDLGEALKAVVTLRKDLVTGEAVGKNAGANIDIDTTVGTKRSRTGASTSAGSAGNAGRANYYTVAVADSPATTLSSADIEQELIDWCTRHLAHYKCPRSVDIVEELPRSPTGKLYKRLLRERYWTGRASKI